MLSEFGRIYQENLRDLTKNDGGVIKFLSTMALEHFQEVDSIIRAIDAHLKMCPEPARVPCLYLIDCILKSDPPSIFYPKISDVLYELFSFAWNRATPSSKELLYKLCKIWTTVERLNQNVVQQCLSLVHSGSFQRSQQVPQKTSGYSYSNVNQAPYYNKQAEHPHYQKSPVEHRSYYDDIPSSSQGWSGHPESMPPNRPHSNYPYPQYYDSDNQQRYGNLGNGYRNANQDKPIQHQDQRGSQDYYKNYPPQRCEPPLPNPNPMYPPNPQHLIPMHSHTINMTPSQTPYEQPPRAAQPLPPPAQPTTMYVDQATGQPLQHQAYYNQPPIMTSQPVYPTQSTALVDGIMPPPQISSIPIGPLTTPAPVLAPPQPQLVAIHAPPFNAPPQIVMPSHGGVGGMGGEDLSTLPYGSIVSSLPYANPNLHGLTAGVIANVSAPPFQAAAMKAPQAVGSMGGDPTFIVPSTGFPPPHRPPVLTTASPDVQPSMTFPSNQILQVWWCSAG